CGRAFFYKSRPHSNSYYDKISLMLEESFVHIVECNMVNFIFCFHWEGPSIFIKGTMSFFFFSFSLNHSLSHHIPLEKETQLSHLGLFNLNL
ncbi:unnamed protein product, partial [Prunus brigantina]